jgi:hypothetical protein
MPDKQGNLRQGRLKRYGHDHDDNAIGVKHYHNLEVEPRSTT